jgi:hypothetical protein
MGILSSPWYVSPRAESFRHYVDIRPGLPSRCSSCGLHFGLWAPYSMGSHQTNTTEPQSIEVSLYLHGMGRDLCQHHYIYHCMAVLERHFGANVRININPSLLFANKMVHSLPVLFLILFFWVFEIQLLMQIIINRIALIAEHRSTVTKLKWGTVALITSINIAVFVIWIPAHTVPPVSETFVKINNVWDKISKVLILIVDAGLNWYFLKTVKTRLVNQHGLTKYAPLVGFNAKLMVLSIAMDVSSP